MDDKVKHVITHEAGAITAKVELSADGSFPLQKAVIEHNEYRLALLVTPRQGRPFIDAPYFIRTPKDAEKRIWAWEDDPLTLSVQLVRVNMIVAPPTEGASQPTKTDETAVAGEHGQ